MFIFASELTSSELWSSELLVTKYSYVKLGYMKFFDRENEIKHLRNIHQLSQKSAQMTIITGRRRIGKTSLILKAYDEVPYLYFFVSRSSESELCAEYVEEIKNKLHEQVFGELTSFQDVFGFLMHLSKHRPFTLVIDEFQEFKRVNPSVFSKIQKIWDLNKSHSHMNLVVCGSVNSLMNKLFRDDKEPLYGRFTDIMTIEPFSPSVLKEILKYYNPSYTQEDLLALYLLTGGVAKYVEIFMDAGAFAFHQMIDKVVSKNSFYLTEGKTMLIEEFGRDFGRYFDILRLMSEGHSSRSEIENILHAELSGYFTRMENDYGLITKHLPMFQKSKAKGVRYLIKDNFLNFWFRFIYKYTRFVEANAIDQLRDIVYRDYNSYSGKILERYFREKLVESGRFTHIGSWWNNKGTVDIDLIAVNDIEKTACFYEVKRQADEFNMGLLQSRVAEFMNATGMYKDYTVTYKGLSMDDM